MSRVLKGQAWTSRGSGDRVTSILIQSPVVPVEEPELEATDPTEVISKRLQETEAICARRLAEAEDTAKRMIESAQAEAERIRSEAHEQGLASGHREGFERAERECEAECRALTGKAQQVVHEANQYRRELLIQMADVFTDVVMTAVKQLLDRELILEPPNVRTMVDKLLTYVLDSTRLEVRVHPDDFAAASEAQASWKGAKFGAWEIVVVPDLAIEVGGCEIRSEYGHVDARLETKLELLEVALREEWERSVKAHADSLELTTVAAT